MTRSQPADRVNGRHFSTGAHRQERGDPACEPVFGVEFYEILSALTELATGDEMLRILDGC